MQLTRDLFAIAKFLLDKQAPVIASVKKEMFSLCWLVCLSARQRNDATLRDIFQSSIDADMCVVVCW